MHLLSQLRRRQRRYARKVLVLFGAVWLNMALQPCAMALEDGAETQHEDCPYCLSVRDSHCGDDDSGTCSFVDHYDYDGRTPAKPEPALGDQVLLALVPVVLEWGEFRSTRSFTHFSHVSAPPGDLTLEYCVFLN